MLGRRDRRSAESRLRDIWLKGKASATRVAPTPPLLSIVTVVRNDADGLAATLDSVLTQTEGLDRTEIVVVDGDSSDGSADLARSLLRRADTLIAEPDEGIYDGMNKGWRASNGAFVQFLNSGDTLHDATSLGAIIGTLEANPQARWMTGRARTLQGGSASPRMMYNLPHIWWRHAMGHQGHCHQACFFSRPLLEVMDGYALDVGFVADFDLILRCGVVAPPLVLDRLIIDYEGGGISAQLGHEIPSLMHAVRVRRLGLSGTALAAEELLLPERHRDSLHANG